ncbi:MAG: methyltransferase domain-containing protein, partial [Desulfobacterota bacterium]|nr:methyltransferase domain-containing protein [Thermodesulfobacteriota bacterium]
MTISIGKWRYLVVLAMLAGTAAAFGWGVSRLSINNDITAALPADDQVVAAARELLRHHPVLDNIFIQIRSSGASENREALVKAADLASAMLSESGLVRMVSSGKAAEAYSAMLDTVTENLPLLLSEKDLSDRVKDLIRPERVESLLQEALGNLLDLAGMGQAQYVAKDPLGLRNLFLERLSSALPFKDAALERGYIMSRDGRNLLLIAKPTQPGQDASFARSLTEVMERIGPALKAEAKGCTMAYVGAFRASLDNETIIRRDTSMALTLVMLSLIPLVLLSFRRPWLGLLSAVPAAAGTMLAVFVYALTGEALFSVAMGFGGALIGIAVDHGLAYVILLDRPGGTEARSASRDIWAVGSLPLLSALAALLSLTAIRIPLFAQVGLFAALGVGLSALYAHLFFPLLLPRLKASKKQRPLPLERLMDRIVAASSGWTLGACAAFALAMLFFARIQFNVDLASMNTLSKETVEAERQIQEVWGAMSARPSLMVQGRSVEELLMKADRLAEFLEKERHSSVLSQDPPRSAALPGPKAQTRHLRAWRDFWTEERILSLENSLKQTSATLGFKADAFDPFLKMLRHPMQTPSAFPQEFLAAFGVFPKEKEGGWVLVDTILPGPGFDPFVFFEKARQQGFLFFDSGHFSKHLAGELNRSFVGILLLVMAVTVAALFLFFLDWQLLLLSIAPVTFSLIATLGTMGLLGLSLSIPSLMLAPLLVGLGLESGIYFVRSYQRFGTAPNPKSDGFRITVMVCGLTTLVGFGSLLFAEHAVLRDAGISTFLGIFYAMVGAFFIVPPVLRFLFRVPPPPAHPLPAGSKEHTRATLMRFRHLEPFPRVFARFKIKLDPMFPRLGDFVKPGMKLADIGCGFGVPAAWLLTLYPDLAFIACDPHPERARIAARVLGGRAEVMNVGAMDLHLDHEAIDAVLLLDMLHYLEDKEVSELLERLRPVLSTQGRLIIRVTLPGTRFSLFRFVEETRLRIKGAHPCWRSKDK